MKNVLLIVLVGSLLLSGIGTTAMQITNLEDDKKDMIFLYDELDQSQTDQNGFYFVGSYLTYTQRVAQTFVPQKGILTRIQLLISKSEVYVPGDPYIIGIRETINGENLAEASVDAENIPTYNADWIEFDFDDIYVDVGETYYIVSYSTEEEFSGIYAWGFSNENPYPNGELYWSQNVGSSWNEISNEDCSFQTFGMIDLDSPGAPSITGEVEGEAGVEYEYTFSSTDPNGDDVYLYIEWGDGELEEWIGPYYSGEEVVVSHTWDEKGDYTLRAKAMDTDDHIGRWGYLEVSMPVNQQVSHPWFNWFLERFPNAFPILRQLLES